MELPMSVTRRTALQSPTAILILGLVLLIVIPLIGFNLPNQYAGSCDQIFQAAENWNSMGSTDRAQEAYRSASDCYEQNRNLTPVWFGMAGLSAVSGMVLIFVGLSRMRLSRTPN